MAVLGDVPRERVTERNDGLVVEHRRPGLRIDQVQAQPEPPAKRIERRRAQVAGRERQPQQVIELSDIAELFRAMPVVGLGDGAHNVAEPDRVGHGEQGQFELAGALGELGGDGSAAGAQPDHEPAGSDPGQPLGEVRLRGGRCADPCPVRQQQLTRAEIVPRRRQVGRVRPGDLPVQPGSAPDQRQL